MALELIDRFFREVDIDNITVKPFDGYIFLCGGALSSSSISSARQYALSRTDSNGCIAGHKVMLAENLTSVLQGDDFLDLLEFEEHIAALSACVLIFVESPGSIAELGSFAVMPHLADKLLVVCEQRLDSALQPSFIFLGPVASLRRRRSGAVQIFPIFNNNDLGADVEKLNECWQFIEESVIESIKRPIPESALNGEELGHRMVVVAALVDIFIALKFGELQSLVSGLGIDLSAKQLKKITRMLEQFSLVKKLSYGNHEFFVSISGAPLVTLRPVAKLDSRIFDRIRFKSDVMQFYEASDKRRYQAIVSFRKSNSA
ncbi:retron St85 family effector protein [Stenotrophomonas geniculata]|uniref:retron St85 family effector protein n=1 Tax=Stenotrophomonas geniculata TaxID=86188 RepID=UPI001F40D844|nr:retron St85 family effector protein [Stenotrophomonas geniculata]MCF3478262.1 hypothetical protein [Stenotrophomonas maltophilia]WNF10886.1 retron St85 family effector protein [Stenotrophomonas geniculata]